MPFGAWSFDELLALLFEVPGFLGKHIFEHRFERRRRDLFGIGDRSFDLRFDLFFELFLFRVAPRALLIEVLSQANDRIALLPDLDDVVFAVRLRIVARGVTRHAVGHRLDERGTFALRGALDGVTRDLVHGEEIVAVAAHARDAVRDALFGERGARGLALDGHADRPAVV